MFLSFYCYSHHRDLHSFPTRRSSDLATVTIGGRPIRLRPDGSFSYRFSLPDGEYELPIRQRKPVTERRSEEHTSELQSQSNLVCRLLLEKKKKTDYLIPHSN